MGSIASKVGDDGLMDDRRALLGRMLVVLTACAAVVCAPRVGAWDDVVEPAPGAPEAIGRYAAGCAIGAERLAPEGRGYQAVNISRNRHYGHPALLEFLRDLAGRAADAGLGLLPIGDISQPRGGPMIHAHASHQVGLDADVYFRLDLPAMAAAEREGLELYSLVDGTALEVNERFGADHATMLRLAASDARVARIFVNPAIKQALCERSWPDRSFLRTLRPWYGHDDHMHVRLRCPPGSVECIDQSPPPPGDGCGAEVAGWLDDGPIPSRPPGERRVPTLPARCDALR